MSEPAFHAVAKTSDLAPGEMTYVDVAGTPVCLINLDGEFFAINDTCTHADASLSDGSIDGDILECPLHGGCFDIRTGAAAAMPVVTPVEAYQVRVTGDAVEVALVER
ncbi:MAG TPA: non-heme iron oxygenase ferredoxin subunit [Thermomicrobiales bacterium]|jgi:nitrite reductase/ring-hydroxylating ferredoxin subunit|nr:non-heme iron oxygenase ferredoxin subunit [Thermomicrobiales bacterium]